MRKFEYAFYVMHLNEKGIRAVNGNQLNELGAQGWEAVCLIDGGGEPISLLLKREVTDPSSAH